ncbi:trans-aconitate 2-methyltransferase [Legionella sp. km772]|uniref:class I SAM-dependent methyltransferase n=1 Tax=Legionella sp. km772 TaxID=2498111 RepID=UPI000F8D8332|nr:class I SAM-dependent methyltransferase [Legionella sp. km772]RUR12460.1 class I SAM-dependent methyltransferase [Legionella sp. km772]
MSHQEWPAAEYAIGSYIQATIAERYLNRLTIKTTDKVLDVGCGDGNFSKRILDRLPYGTLLGIDASENMLQLAEEVKKAYPNFSTQQANVTSMNFQGQFDYLVSFWCLQWSQDIHQAYSHIFHALKKGGKFLTLFPLGDDPYIQSYYAVRESQQFPVLNNFTAPVDYSKFANLEEQLASIPFHSLRIERCQQQLILPSLEVFRKFVNGIAFYQGQIAAEEIKTINEAMVEHYQKECEANYDGEYQFNLSIFLITGEK